MERDTLIIRINQLNVGVGPQTGHYLNYLVHVVGQSHAATFEQADVSKIAYTVLDRLDNEMAGEPVMFFESMRSGVLDNMVEKLFV